MSEFKPGDRIRIRKDYADGATVYTGDLGTVVRAADDFGLEAQMDVFRENYEVNRDFHWYLSPENVEKIESSTEETETELPDAVLEASGTDLLRSLAEAASELNLGVSISFYPLTEDSGSEDS